MILINKCYINDENLFGPHFSFLLENISAGTDDIDKTHTYDYKYVLQVTTITFKLL